VVSGMGYSGLVGLANIDQHENQTFVGVQATYDLYRNGRRKSQIEEFESSIRGLEHQKSKSILNIRSMLNQQIYQAETAFKILKKQKKVLKISRKIREHVQKQYGEGEVNLTRLNEVQNDLIRAAGSVAASGVSLKLLLVQIDSTTGRILEGFLPNMVKK
jgi:outer membrane protein TolC